MNRLSDRKVWLEVASDGALFGVFLLVMLFLALPPFLITPWTGSPSNWMNVVLYVACAAAIVRSLYRGFWRKP